MKMMAVCIWRAFLFEDSRRSKKGVKQRVNRNLADLSIDEEEAAAAAVWGWFVGALRK